MRRWVNPRRLQVRTLGFVGLFSLAGAGIGVGAAGCDAPSTPAVGPAVPEPKDALRPEGQRGEVPASAHVVDYDIRARLDTDDHQISGSERIVWRNTTGHPTDEVQMHLYMNAFRAEDTAWMAAARGSHRGQGQDPKAPWGYTDVQKVHRIRTEGSEDTASELVWAEAEDPSVMHIELDEPVGPGEEIVLDLEFVTRLPGVFARTGFHDDFVMAAQWFPKVGVFEEDGHWDTHVFTLYSEFYADFGDYDVELDVPASMTVGASGIRTEETVDGDRKRLKYRAQMVHDFAWTAAPEFAESFGEYEGIRIRQLLAPEFAEQAPAHLDAQIAALQSMEKRFGPYPWSTITIVLPPEGAEGAGGMEYPTLYTTSAIASLPAILEPLGFEERISGTFTTIHEFGHQYFQGLLASDEFDQPWLDEGMNTMSNALALEDWYGDDPWIARFAGHEFPLSAMLRTEMSRSEATGVVDRDAAAFEPEVGSYGVLTYRRTAAVMLTLRHLVGHEAFDAALKRYALRYRFAHPTGDDLRSTLIEELGAKVLVGRPDPDQPRSEPVALDVGRFFDQGLRSAKTVDFALLSVKNRRKVGSGGWHRNEEGVLVEGDPPSTEPVSELPDEEIEGVVVVHRPGDFVVPVEVEVEFADGSTTRRVWDGQERIGVLEFPGRRVRRAAVDPDGKLLLESKRRNNNRWASGSQPDRSLANTVGGLTEAAALASLVGVGP